MELADPYTYHLKVLNSHLDCFGHVNHAQYLCLFEDARWNMLQFSGITPQYVLDHHVGPVVLNLTVKYKRELKYLDEVCIKTSFQGKINKLVFALEQKMIKVVDGQDVLTSEIELHCGIMDLKKRKLMPFDDSFYPKIFS